MARVIITLLDSFGIGWAHDAADFGDEGADTLGHIAAWLAANPRPAEGKVRPLFLPNPGSPGTGKGTSPEYRKGIGSSFVRQSTGRRRSG